MAFSSIRTTTIDNPSPPSSSSLFSKPYLSKLENAFSALATIMIFRFPQKIVIDYKEKKRMEFLYFISNFLLFFKRAVKPSYITPAT
ncbi:hypothetical protein L6452_16696 [Arctium lappa]|uniref:Uncharacterized protein n=1 Tax=Arctium lappa TaxID=4217 RepID=A0ACB9C1E7_ARCLA|nr:hypothetical protein L6452_16696 [Arctium lappa]